ISHNLLHRGLSFLAFFFQAEDGIRDWSVTGVQTCALPICLLQGRRQAASCGLRHAQTPPTLQPVTSARRAGDDWHLISHGMSRWGWRSLAEGQDAHHAKPLVRDWFANRSRSVSCPLEGLLGAAADLTHPDLDGEHSVGRNQPRDSLLSIGEVRADPNLPMSPRLHPDQSFLDARNGFTFP